jgi:hypothetical protein
MNKQSSNVFNLHHPRYAWDARCAERLPAAGTQVDGRGAALRTSSACAAKPPVPSLSFFSPPSAARLTRIAVKRDGYRPLSLGDRSERCPQRRVHSCAKHRYASPLVGLAAFDMSDCHKYLNISFELLLKAGVQASPALQAKLALQNTGKL